MPTRLEISSPSASMNKYRKSHNKLQALERTLTDGYNQGTLSEELSIKLRAQGMIFGAPPEPSEPWEVIVEQRPASLLPLPPPIAEETPAEDSGLYQETVEPETPQASPMAEEAVEVPEVPVEVPLEEDSSPDREEPEIEKDGMEKDRVAVAGKGSERHEEEQEWEREGYGICIGCADVYILRCNGNKSPWAKGSDKPEEKDGKFVIECGDCRSEGEAGRKAKKKGGFGGFGSMYEDGVTESGRRGLFGQIGLNPRLFHKAEVAGVVDVVRGREVRFVTLRGGVAFLEVEELLRMLPKGAEVGKIRVDLYGRGQRQGLIGRGIGGLI